MFLLLRLPACSWLGCYLFPGLDACQPAPTALLAQQQAALGSCGLAPTTAAWYCVVQQVGVFIFYLNGLFRFFLFFARGGGRLKTLDKHN